MLKKCNIFNTSPALGIDEQTLLAKFLGKIWTDLRLGFIQSIICPPDLWDSQAVSRLWWNGDFGKLSYSRATKRPSKYMWLKCSRIGKEDVIQYSLAPSSVYPGLLQTLQQRISHFPNFSVSQVLNRPNMCYIFEKHWIQGYQIWHSRVSNVKYTNTRLHKYANTQIQSA